MSENLEIPLAAVRSNHNMKVEGDPESPMGPLIVDPRGPLSDLCSPSPSQNPGTRTNEALPLVEH